MSSTTKKWIKELYYVMCDQKYISYFEHTGIWGRAGHADPAYGFMRICVSMRICAFIFQFQLELLSIGLHCRPYMRRSQML